MPASITSNEILFWALEALASREVRGNVDKD